MCTFVYVLRSRNMKKNEVLILLKSLRNVTKNAEVLYENIKQLEEAKQKLEEKELLEKRKLEFSTNVDDVQDFCFNTGISGNCNSEDCEKYGSYICTWEDNE